jgi:hypothetical protein
LQVWRNSRYQVNITRLEDREPFGVILWLSIKRLDRRPIRDWRELQRIKNELVGPEVEAVEMFPAESRLCDTSNQFHLHCFPNGYKLPFGYAEREVMEHPELAPGGLKARQEPWPEDARPADLADPKAPPASSARLVTPIYIPGQGGDK